MGREVRLPAELLFGSTGAQNGEEITSYGEYVDLLRSRMQHAHEVARKYLATAAKRSKDSYDLVWYLDEVHAVGEAPKLKRDYIGPVPVKKKVTAVDYMVQLDASGKELLMHHNKLKPYEGDRIPKWVKRAVKKLLKK